jgi:hypothetical protein
VDHVSEDAQVLIRAALEVHVERHGAKTFLPGALLPFLEAAERAGIRSDRQRYYGAIEDLEYQGAIEWDKSARYARGTNTTSRISEGFRSRFPRLTELMEEDVLSYAAFPAEHWQKIWSNNPLQRVYKEIKRRTNVVGIFPNEAALIRLVGSVLSEQHDEWQVSKRYFSVGSLAKVDRREEQIAEQQQLVAI